jgi:hypothetical protein
MWVAFSFIKSTAAVKLTYRRFIQNLTPLEDRVLEEYQVFHFFGFGFQL